MECHFLTAESGDVQYVCKFCGKETPPGRRYPHPPRRNCPKGGGQSSAPIPVDAAQWFTTHYAKQDCPMLPLSAILAKLERCRSADCETLQDDVCTMLGSNACKQRSNWFRMLAGGAVCQNWKRKSS